MKVHLFILLFSVLLVFGSPHAVQAGLIFSVNYDDGTFGTSSPANLCSQSFSGYPSLARPHSAQVVSSPARAGGKAVKFTLLPTDTGYQYCVFQNRYVRAELEKINLGKIGDTMWYGFSVLIPTDWKDSTTDTNGTIIFQTKTNKDSCDKGGNAPELEIHITPANQWRVRNHSDPLACSLASSHTRVDWNLGTVTKGAWVDWVINIKWSYGSDGFLKVWKNGALVAQRNGPVVFNNQSTLMTKWGIYKSRWNNETPVDTFVSYHDELKVGDANSSYEEVAPKNAQSASPTAPAMPGNLRAINIQ